MTTENVKVKTLEDLALELYDAKQEENKAKEARISAEEQIAALVVTSATGSNEGARRRSAAIRRHLPSCGSPRSPRMSGVRREGMGAAPGGFAGAVQGAIAVRDGHTAQGQRDTQAGVKG